MHVNIPPMPPPMLCLKCGGPITYADRNSAVTIHARHPATGLYVWTGPYHAVCAPNTGRPPQYFQQTTDTKA